MNLAASRIFRAQRLEGTIMFPINTILFPTDFSPHATFAFPLACALARDHGARLVLVHVHQPPLPVYGEFGAAFPAEAPEVEEALLHQLCELRPPDPAIPVEHYLTNGEPAEAILRMARAHKPDLIVMGTHGRSGLGRLFMGSVAEQVLRDAPCPVVTVKGPLPNAVATAASAEAVAAGV
jgi:universal stress protein A